MNVTLSLLEVWGWGFNEDPMAYFFRNSFEAANLIDATPYVLVSTWSNGCVGKGRIVKILDCFLIAKDISRYFGKFRSWFVSLGLSEHEPIILELDIESSKVSYPFKVNHSWIYDKYFFTLIHSKWK